MRQPKVSVVVPYYNGIEHLPHLLGSLAGQDYPRELIECLLVQNGQDDGLRHLVGERFPWVEILQPGDNLGYGGGCNYGARHAQGEWLALLNTDMKLDEHWLSELVAASERHPEAACLGSAILSWDGKRLDFSGSALSFTGVGFQPYYGGPAKWLPDEDSRQLFVCGGATFVRRDVFLEVGGFDEDFWAYFEDVDLGWRLGVLGYDVWLVPTSVVYHRHHGSFGGLGEERRRLLMERNAILAVIKNYENGNLERILPVVLMLAAKRAFLATGVDQAAYRIGKAPPNAVAPKATVFGLRYYLGEAVRTLRHEGLVQLWKRAIAEIGRRFALKGEPPYGAPKNASPVLTEGVIVPRLAMAHLLALSDVADLYPAMMPKRAWIQAHRRRRDRELLPMFHMPYGLSFWDSRYHACFQALVQAAGLEEVLGEALDSEAKE